MSERFPHLLSGIDDWDSFEDDFLTDPTIRSESQDGVLLSRTGPGALLRVWHYRRRGLTRGDVQTLYDWQVNTVHIGGLPFLWQDPRPFGDEYTVRLGSPLKFTPLPGRVGYYDILLHLIEDDL